MKYFVLLSLILSVGLLITPTAFAELDSSILEPFKNSDLVVIGKIIQVNTIISENKTEYNIQVEEYLKNQKSFEMITAILDGVRSPDFPSYPMDFPNSNPLDYYNKPYFEEGNQVLVYLKQEGGIYKMSPYSFTIEKKDVAGPPIVILPTDPQEHNFSQGDEIIISGVIKKGYMYELGQTEKDSSLNLVILNEKGESIVSKKLTVNVDSSYQFPFQMKGDLRIPGKYSWEIQFGHDTMGGEFIIEIVPALWTPLKQIKSGIKFHNVECNEGLVLAQRGNTERSACVKLDTKIELTVRGWAYDDRVITGCLGDRVKKCYPDDKDEYRKALQHYYYGTDLESEPEINSTSNISPIDTLSISLIPTQINPNEPGPPPVRLGEHGKSMSEDEIKSRTSFEISKFKDTADIKIDRKHINLLDIRIRSNGDAVYYYYGPDIEHGDSTTLMDFMNEGGVIVKTLQMKNPESVFSSLANFEGMQGKIFSENGIVAHGDESNGLSPSIVYLYPGDDRIISVWANASLEDTIKLAEKLVLENHGLDLSKYTDENWADKANTAEPSDEIPPVEPTS